MGKFVEAVKQVVEQRDNKKYNKGITAGEVLNELRKREKEFDINLSLTTVLDVRDVLEVLYKPLSGISSQKLRDVLG